MDQYYSAPLRSQMGTMQPMTFPLAGYPQFTNSLQHQSWQGQSLPNSFAPASLPDYPRADFTTQQPYPYAVMGFPQTATFSPLPPASMNNIPFAFPKYGCYQPTYPTTPLPRTTPLVNAIPAAQYLQPHPSVRVPVPHFDQYPDSMPRLIPMQATQMSASLSPAVQASRRSEPGEQTGSQYPLVQPRIQQENVSILDASQGPLRKASNLTVSGIPRCFGLVL